MVCLLQTDPTCRRYSIKRHISCVFASGDKNFYLPSQKRIRKDKFHNGMQARTFWYWTYHKRDQSSLSFCAALRSIPSRVSSSSILNDTNTTFTQATRKRGLSVTDSSYLSEKFETATDQLHIRPMWQKLLSPTAKKYARTNLVTVYKLGHFKCDLSVTDNSYLSKKFEKTIGQSRIRLWWEKFLFSIAKTSTRGQIW